MARYQRIDWTGSDFDSIRADVIARIERVFPDWTDHSPANPGMVLADLLCMIGDLIRYYQDRQANEAFLVTAQDRANVIRHLAAIGYILSTASPATTTLQFTLSAAQATSLVIDLAERPTTQDGSYGYETQARLEIPAGSLVGTVVAIEGLTVNEQLGVSDGSAGQRYVFGQTPYIFGSEVVTVDGVAWTYVVDFLSSGAASNHYSISVDAFDQGAVVFGDGINGARPNAGAQVSGSYRVGGGIGGNVDANSITKLPRSYATVAGVPVTLSVTNPSKAADGTDRETAQHGQLWGPKSLSTQNRSVAASDYATNASLVPGVARALAQVSDDDDTIDDNTVFVQIVPVGSGAPTPALIQAVLTQLTVNKPKPNTTRVIVAPAIYANIAPVGTFYVARSEAGESILQPTLEATGDAFMAALARYFSASTVDATSGKPTIDFGKKIPLSKLYKIAESVQASGSAPKVGNIAYFDLLSPIADVGIQSKQFPRLSAYTKRIVAGPPIQIIYSWTLTSGTIVVQEEP